MSTPEDQQSSSTPASSEPTSSTPASAVPGEPILAPIGAQSWETSGEQAPAVGNGSPATAPRRTNRLVVGIGSALTIGLLGLGAASIMSSGTGASSPEGAVEQLADALSQEDFFAAMSTFAPDEVRSMPEVYQLSAKRSSELGLPNSVEGDKVKGIDIKVENLKLKTTQLSDDIAKVEILDGKISSKVEKDSALASALGMTLGRMTGGSSAYASEDGSSSCTGLTTSTVVSGTSHPAASTDGAIEAPADITTSTITSDSMTSTACEDFTVSEPSWDAGDESSPVKGTPTDGSIDLGKASQRASEDGGPGIFAMAVQRDGDWYLSPAFTTAEYVRSTEFSDTKIDYSAANAGPAQSTPSKALAAVVAGFNDADLDAATNAMSSELAVYRVYKQLIDSEEMASAKDDLTSLNITDLKTHEEKIDDSRVRVVVDEFAATVDRKIVDYDSPEYDAWLEDDACASEDCDYADPPAHNVTASASLKDGCVTLDDGEGKVKNYCLADVAAGALHELKVDRLAFVAVADRAGWAISPVESIADYLRTAVTNFSKPVQERLLGEAGGMALGATSVEEPKVTATLEEGSNTVKLSAAGLAYVKAPSGEAALIVTTDEGFDVKAVDAYEDSSSEALVNPGATLLISGKIGAKTATVTVQRITSPRVTVGAPVSGELKDGETVYVDVTGISQRFLDVAVDANTTVNVVELAATDSTDSNLTYMRLERGTTPESGDSNYEFQTLPAADGTYTLTALEFTAGFNGAGPGSTTVSLADSEPVQLAVEANSPLAVTATLAPGVEGTVEIELWCNAATTSPAIELTSATQTGVVYATGTEDEVCQVFVSSDQPSLGRVQLMATPTTPEVAAAAMADVEKPSI